MRISLESGGGLRLTNSTIASNQSDEHGGGLSFENNTRGAILSSTIVRNQADFDQAGFNGDGGGIFNNSSFDIDIRNSLVAANKEGAVINDCAGTALTSGGHNLFSTVTSGSTCSGLIGSDRVRSNSKIGPLAGNGGPTQTVALRKGSPAINKADKGSSPKRDQRGRKRDKKPDIGAFEQ